MRFGRMTLRSRLLNGLANAPSAFFVPIAVLVGLGDALDRWVDAVLRSGERHDERVAVFEQTITHDPAGPYRELR
jgi:hypothetical protein